MAAVEAPERTKLPIRIEATVDLAESEAQKFNAGTLADAIVDALRARGVPVENRSFHVIRTDEGGPYPGGHSRDGN